GRRRGGQEARGLGRRRDPVDGLEQPPACDQPRGAGRRRRQASRNQEHPCEAAELERPRPLPDARRQQRYRRERGHTVVLEPGRRTREEREQASRPGPEKGGRARRRGGVAPSAPRRFAERQGNEQHPRRRPGGPGSQEEGQGIAGGIAGELAIQEEEQVLIHHVVPEEAGMPVPGQQVPGKDDRHHYAEAERRTKPPKTPPPLVAQRDENERNGDDHGRDEALREHAGAERGAHAG